ncbi:MAG: glycoside hydrolase family 95 protein [Candidatus Marinimicrobia bacterium]|nr:glycoside hydrolase family 95 protein [Candidatus Neomarinimicrobiota bacterium]
MKIKNNVMIFLFAGLVMMFSVSGNAQASSKEKEPTGVLKYAKPAADWMTEALPIGNGRIGGMIFGGINEEHIQFNENSLWTGDEKDTGEYQDFGDLFITFSNEESAVPVDYQRKLDLNQALHQTAFTLDGIKYSREYFCSHPDQVIALQFKASGRGAISATLKLNDAHGEKIIGEGNSLHFSGKLNNGMQYAAQITVKTKGGKVGIVSGDQGDQLQVESADELLVLLDAATDFIQDRSKNWKGEDPQLRIKRELTAAGTKSYQELKKRHITDYTALFDRVALTLGETDQYQQSMPMDKRLETYQPTQDPGLEALMFQYGRYLLISSSREGGLPANLQGLWNDSNHPAWRGDYHSNINVEMNYWPAEPANLSECHVPFLDYVVSTKDVRKEQTSEHYSGVRGWTYQTENNIFGGASYTWNPPASAWYALHFWEHYAFTRDSFYLKETAYPLLKELCWFWEDHLKEREDGTLVSPDGWSPEQGPIEEGVTYDQEIIYDLFTNYIEASEILNVDADYRARITDMRNRLLKPKIGRWGQLQEWEKDVDDPNNKHRHVSHLFALHPGRQISPLNTPELAEAARVSLTARGDKATGWSMAWKMNFWARLLDGNHAYTILSNFMHLAKGHDTDYSEGGGVYSNLLCAHPPFQVDGNLGYVAGVAEMLLQSQTDALQLLPALPNAWPNGSVKGLCTRGGFVVDMDWIAGNLRIVRIKSNAGCPLKIVYKDKVVEYKLAKGDEIKLDADLKK